MKNINSPEVKVTLVRSRENFNGVDNCLNLLKDDIKESLSNISSIVVKINMVITKTPHYIKGVELAATPFQSVKSFIEFLIPFYKGEIIIAEQAAWGDTKDGFEIYGFTKLVKEYSQVKLLDLKGDEKIIKSIKYPEGELTLPLSKTLIEAPYLVSITRPKTHCSVGVTLGIKNVLVGVIQGYSQRRKIHKDQYIHHFIASIADYVYPDLVIIDGTIGMEGGGPVRGSLIKSGWTLASLDPLGADSVACYLMGHKIENVEYLKILKKKKMGFLYPIDNINIIGEKPEEMITPYKPHPKFKKFFIKQ